MLSPLRQPCSKSDDSELIFLCKICVCFFFLFAALSTNQMIVISQSSRRRRTDILYVDESSVDVGEQTVGETTRRRNDWLPHCLPLMHFEFIARYFSIPLTRQSKSINMAAKLVVD